LSIEQSLYTVGDLAAQLGQSIHRVQYLIHSRALCPVRRVGNLRVFDESALMALRKAAAEADRRSGKEVTSDVR